jgi:hypothetical protein
VKGMEWNAHSSLFPPNPKFPFPSKLGGIGVNEILLNKIHQNSKNALNLFIIIIFLNPKLSMILTSIFSNFFMLPLSSQTKEFFLSLIFLGYHQHNSKINKKYIDKGYIYIYIYIYIIYIYFSS